MLRRELAFSQAGLPFEIPLEAGDYQPPGGADRIPGPNFCDTAGEMDDRDRLLLDELQNDLPLVAKPFAALGERIGMPEDEILERIERLRGEGVVRQMSAIFDTRRLGYKSQPRGRALARRHIRRDGRRCSRRTRE